MIKQLTRNGNSLALVLDRALLDLIHVDAEAPVVELSAEGDRLIVRAADAERVAEFQARKQKIRDAYAVVKKRSAATFRRLAE